MEWLDYREKLGVDFYDEERGEFCSSIIINKLNDFLNSRKDELDFIDYFDFDAVLDDEYKCFCNKVGMQYGDILSVPINKIISALEEHKNPFKLFIAYYVAFINSVSDRNDGLTKQQLLDILNNSFEESRLNYSLLIDGNDYFIFPKGAKELDDALVSEPLEWLKDYPLTQKEWIDALKNYSEATEQTASETADKFRKALERFFQEFFNSTQSLEKLISEYGNFLSSKGVPAELSNDFKKLLDAYTKYNNNYAKHHNKVSKSVLEYIMYQTGNLIRLMITLK